MFSPMRCSRRSASNSCRTGTIRTPSSRHPVPNQSSNAEAAAVTTTSATGAREGVSVTVDGRGYNVVVEPGGDIQVERCSHIRRRPRRLQYPCRKSRQYPGSLAGNIFQECQRRDWTDHQIGRHHRMILEAAKMETEVRRLSPEPFSLSW